MTHYLLQNQQILMILMILVFILSRNVTAGSIVEDKFSSLVKNLDHYELITPEEYLSGSLHQGSGISRLLKVSAFGHQYEIELRKQNSSFYNGAIVEYVGKNSSYQAKFLSQIDCLFSGTIKNLNNISSPVLINACDGYEGIIPLESTTMFIAPLQISTNITNKFRRRHIIYKMEDFKTKPKHIDSMLKPDLSTPRKRGRSRVKRSNYESFMSVRNKSGRRVQLYYLDSYDREVPFLYLYPGERRGINTFVGTIWIAKDDVTKQILYLDGRRRYVSTLNRKDRVAISVTKPVGMRFDDNTETNKVDGNEHYIEVMVVADDSVTNFHGKNNVEKYILTMMNIATNVFKSKSLSVRINLHVVRIVLIEDDQTGFRLYKRNPSKTLVSACNFVSTLQNNNNNHIDHFDFAVVLTRKDFGPSGFAQLYSMCSSKRSCVLVKDEGLTSAFIIAHETGHLLGLDHDGEGESSRCRDSDTMMAPVIIARFDRYRWSQCSKEVLEETLSYFHCLKNKPNERKINRYPLHSGSMYTLDEQCVFTFDKFHTRCDYFRYDPCNILWCNNPRRNSYCKTMRAPALEGSICGRNKYCIQGKCKEADLHSVITPPPTTTKIIVDGNWGSWYSWSDCSLTCSLGIRSRIRNCDSPSPDANGKPCQGLDLEQEVCNTQACSVIKSFESFRNEQCVLENGDGWTYYTPLDFEVRLRQRRNNLNCSFETGLCNWKEDGKFSDIPWIQNNGKTPSANTGPSIDHTQGNHSGKYVHIEASSTSERRKVEGNVARLLSPVIRVPQICFTWFYHMFGSDMGELQVNLLYSNGSEKHIWSRKGNHGDIWLEAQATFESVVDYQIVIQAIRGVHWAGDIAIDDLSAVTGQCMDSRKEINPCKLSCRSRDARKFNMNMNAVDGRRCHATTRSSDICLNGKCVKFGCDNKFYSSLVFDNCRICGGNGSSCLKVEGRKSIVPKKDYESLLKIPKGSTYINVTDFTEEFHYFGLRKVASGVHLSTRMEDYFVIEGITFHFRKDRNGRQHIYSDGPTKTDLELVIYSFSHQRRKPVVVYYELFELVRTKVSYKYEIKAWEPCSTTCGTGKQKSIPVCLRLPDLNEVDVMFCKHLRKPLFLRVCKLHECSENYKWHVRSWNPCSKTCGSGYKTRLVRCLRTRDNAFVSTAHCPKPVPSPQTTCNLMECPRIYKWLTSKWEVCSESCGTGIQTRSVVCTDSFNKQKVADRKCASLIKPNVLEPCNIFECDTFIWNVTMAGQCTKSCGGGIQARIINCMNEKTKLLVDNNYCDGPSPQRISSCNQHLCPEYVWDIVESSPCSATCGGGTITREIQCINKMTNLHERESNCKAQKPSRVITCNERKCTSYKVAYSVWSGCSTQCGIGIQKRHAYCVSSDYQSVVSADLCAKGNYTLQRTCKKLSCAPAEDLKCNFDDRNFGNWINVQSENFDWTISNRTPSLNTGPLMDHTTHTGYFAYIEASRPRRRGDKAQLTSPFLKVARGCFIFWYHMRGTTIGKLSVIISSKDGSRTIFEKERHRGIKWFLAKIDVTENTPVVAYRIIIEASVGHGVYGDIAIDDIEYFDTPCAEVRESSHLVVPAGCREISPYCNHNSRKQYCIDSKAYRALCCKTCASLLSAI